MPIKSPWAQTLQPASYNGTAFVVESSTYSTGRRVASHEYPYRDNPWIEDLGLRTRTIEFSGFLVGNDCYAQRDAMKKACEKGGLGTLIHPSLGTLQVGLTGAGFTERADRGRVVEVQFQFMVSDEKPRWPMVTTNTKASVATNVLNLNTSVANTFFANVQSALKQGTAAIQGVTSQIQGALSQVQGAIGQVSGVFAQVQGVTGTLEGFVNTALTPLRDASAIFNSVNGVANLLSPEISLGRFINPVSVLSNPINVVLGGITQVAGVANQLESGVSSILNNVTAVRATAQAAINSAISLSQAL